MNQPDDSIRNKAARVIQLKFLDWFYKPLCKDGTYGIDRFNKIFRDNAVSISRRFIIIDFKNGILDPSCQKQLMSEF
jgi:hypothetical protein